MWRHSSSPPGKARWRKSSSPLPPTPSRSYKADDRARQTPERLIARKDLLHALEQGTTGLSLRLRLTHAQRDALADDPTGDSLDAVLCLLQAAWAAAEGAPWYGLPPTLDPLEGWIVGT